MFQWAINPFEFYTSPVSFFPFTSNHAQVEISNGVQFCYVSFYLYSKILPSVQRIRQSIISIYLWIMHDVIKLVNAMTVKTISWIKTHYSVVGNTVWDTLDSNYCWNVYIKFKKKKKKPDVEYNMMFLSTMQSALTSVTLTYLTAHSWQKWKRELLTCHCHKIYRDEAVGLKSCKNTWKITIFVKMWNLGQYRENLIFCQ